jgi:hypothetical protein
VEFAMAKQCVTLAAALALLALCSGCARPIQPEEFFQLTPQSAADRATQTRMFETADATELLSASAAVLQDLGFQVEESARELGFLRAAKERSAREYGQDITRLVVWILTTPLIMGNSLPLMIPVDLHQKIAATLVARPINPDATRYEVRITFYRIVWKGEGMGGRDAIPPGGQWMEMIREPRIYQQFFAKLSKAMFLEAFTL